jgi:Type I restriction modification DNA specificity domain
VTAIFDDGLPPGWARVTLGEVTQPTRPRVRPQDHSNLPFIGMEHVEAHSMRLLGTVAAGQMKSSTVYFQPGDVLYGRLRLYLNKVYLPDFEGLCSAEFIVFPATEILAPKYLQYLLNSTAFVSFASHLNTGDRPRVDFDQLSVYQIPISPLPEQRRIVAEIEKQFTRLEAAVAALKRLQANLKRYRASVLKAACEGRWTKTLWIYDFRTNEHFTLKTKPLKRSDLDDFVACYNPENRYDRKATERFKPFEYDELVKRDKGSLDIFWLKDESLEDSAKLPNPDVIALEIAEDLEAALDQFSQIAADLKS